MSKILFEVSYSPFYRPSEHIEFHANIFSTQKNVTLKITYINGSKAFSKSKTFQVYFKCYWDKHIERKIVKHPIILVWSITLPNTKPFEQYYSLSVKK